MTRRDFADALRGFALIGICIVNIPFMAWGLLPVPTPQTAWDWAAAIAVTGLFEGKFFILFSFLFGFGLAVQSRADAAGRLPKGAFPRRLWGLLVLGVAHGALLFPGDILTGYALLGAILWRLRAAPDRQLIRLGGLALLFSLPAFAALDLLGQLVASPSAETLAAVKTAYRGGGLESLAQRAADWALTVAVVIPLYNGPMAFAAFCFGTVAGRRDALADPGQVRAWIGRWRWALGVGALLGNGFAVAGLLLGAKLLPVALPGISLGGPCLALLFVWGLTYAPETWAYRRLVAAGRMSLTLYLGQSLIGVIVMQGFGLFGGLSATACFGLAVGMALSLNLSASLWLRGFRYGPAEWLLRCWTYRAWLPLRV